MIGRMMARAPSTTSADAVLGGRVEMMSTWKPSRNATRASRATRTSLGGACAIIKSVLSGNLPLPYDSWFGLDGFEVNNDRPIVDDLTGRTPRNMSHDRPRTLIDGGSWTSCTSRAPPAPHVR